MPTTTRIHNFSAGPAVLPLPVLEEAQRHLISLPGVGMSVMEISHRSSTFEDLLNGAIEDIRALASVPANYKILMLQGGASLQFSMVPMNLLTPGSVADYVDTGSWSDKAIKEAKKVGKVNVAFVHGCADASKQSFSVAIPQTLHSDGPVPYQLIILFTQEDCRICLFEAEYWERIHQEFSPRLEVKGLTQYDPEFVDSFSRSTGISFPIVQDAAGFETTEGVNENETQLKMKLGSMV